jgi:hypothetical protein
MDDELEELIKKIEKEEVFDHLDLEVEIEDLEEEEEELTDDEFGDDDIEELSF